MYRLLTLFLLIGCIFVGSLNIEAREFVVSDDDILPWIIKS